MSGHGYETGRLNLPFVGIATFGKRPYVQDWAQIDADVAVMGAPFGAGTQFRAGARFGPRSVREASTLFSFGHAGAYDHEDDCTYLPESVKEFPGAVDLADLMRGAGFATVDWSLLTGGIAALHVARKG